MPKNIWPPAMRHKDDLAQHQTTRHHTRPDTYNTRVSFYRLGSQKQYSSFILVSVGCFLSRPECSWQSFLWRWQAFLKLEDFFEYFPLPHLIWLLYLGHHFPTMLNACKCNESAVQDAVWDSYLQAFQQLAHWPESSEASLTASSTHLPHEKT